MKTFRSGSATIITGLGLGVGINTTLAGVIILGDGEGINIALTEASGCVAVQETEISMLLGIGFK